MTPRKEKEGTTSPLGPVWAKVVGGFTVTIVVAVIVTIGWLDSNYAKRAALDAASQDLSTLSVALPLLTSQVRVVESKHAATLKALERIERSQDKLEQRIDALFSKVVESMSR